MNLTVDGGAKELAPMERPAKIRDPDPCV